MLNTQSTVSSLVGLQINMTLVGQQSQRTKFISWSAMPGGPNVFQASVYPTSTAHGSALACRDGWA
eukprot:896930-Amphidinium_carterae.1